MINIHAWNRSTKCTQAVSPSDLETGAKQLLGPDMVVWIDVSEPTAEEESLVLQKFLPIHPLSLEDVTRLRREPDALPHFPKVEEFDNYLFVIVNPLTGGFLHSVRHHNGQPANRPFTQLSAILTQNVLITHHYEPISCLEQVRNFVERHNAQFERGPDYVYHLVLDSTVDQYVPVLDSIDDRLDTMETAVMQRPRPKLYHGLLHLKREIIVLRKTLIYEREVLIRLARGDFELVDERETVYYRNVYDHLARFSELIESSRDMAADLMQSYLASVSNKLNEIMKVLTMISTVVLPMTLIAGIYGMNFQKMLPAGDWPFGFLFAVLLMVLCGIGSLAYFLWRRWL